ncbi:MAG: serine--tRNA ligase [Pseudomonadota bacterium]
MHDIKLIRDNPDTFDAALAKRSVPPQANKLASMDADLRAVVTELGELQALRNAASKQIGAAMGKGEKEEAERLKAEVADAKTKMETLEARRTEAETHLNNVLLGLPNLPAGDVPEGADEASNVELRSWGDPAEIAGAKEHFDIGEALGLLDFETAAKLSGSRFNILYGGLARLERAIASFMLDLHTAEFGYLETVTPVLVRDDPLYGTGQLPKFADDQFKTENGFWLIPTAEVTLTNTVREQIITDEELPKRFSAWTQCFRSEAGAAGRDTRGLIRLHQFSKVELVSITTPEKSEEEHERMTACAEEVLKRLELPYRVMLLSSGDMGFSARKTYDLEVWLPGQKQYREISSCSNCGDFQARRMKARCRPQGEKQTRFVHTLNGSGLAVGRTMVAIMETYQQPDGSIAVPDALKPYMGGLDRIEGIS